MVQTFSSHYILLTGLLAFGHGLSVDDGSYRHTLLFPPIRGEIQGLKQIGNNPAIQTTAGFHLNPPSGQASLPLSFIQPFPISQTLFSGTPFMAFRRLVPPRMNLFLPNTIKQPVESRAQFEEYKKYLKETAEEDEKERNLNVVGIDKNNFFETTSKSEDESPTTGSFVKLHVQGKDYSYTTAT